MTISPLDAPTGFNPADNERPAGQWMEAYWAQTAPWAKRFAFAIWAYSGWFIFHQFRGFSTLTAYIEGVVYPITVLLSGSLYAVLGYFCFRFGQDLERAVVGQDQTLLEKAFRQLNRFLLSSLVIAALWILPSAILWHTAYQFWESYYSPGERYEQPLQSD